MAKSSLKPLPVPGFVSLDNASKWGFAPDQRTLFGRAEEWKRQHGIKPCGSDKVGSRIELLAIDVQKDFCFPDGTLYVGGRSGRGAIEDNQRLASFIYRNLGVLTSITATMDTHFSYQIFFPSFWQKRDDSPVAEHTAISLDMIRKGEVKPNPVVASIVCNGNYAWLCQYVKHYAEQLEKAKKYTLYIWPYHCLLGSDGHVLSGLVYEAMLFHSFARGAHAGREIKGGGILTENYSVLSPEVITAHDGQSVGQRNTPFIKKLLERDAVIIAGQAASHCVKSSIDDLLDAINAQDPTLAQKVYVMTDCMSAVAVPDGKGGFYADFTPQAEEAQKRFADAGMHLVKSTDPIESWPGIKL
jgi:nicotinamidase-related amidase